MVGGCGCRWECSTQTQGGWGVTAQEDYYMHSVGRRVLGGVVGVVGEAEAGEVGGGGGHLWIQIGLTPSCLRN